MSRLLINEPPLIVLPSLAKEIGLNEAIIVQQIQYWLSAPGGGAYRVVQTDLIGGFIFSSSE